MNIDKKDIRKEILRDLENIIKKEDEKLVFTLKDIELSRVDMDFLKHYCDFCLQADGRDVSQYYLMSKNNSRIIDKYGLIRISTQSKGISQSKKLIKHIDKQLNKYESKQLFKFKELEEFKREDLILLEKHIDSLIRGEEYSYRNIGEPTEKVEEFLNYYSLK